MPHSQHFSLTRFGVIAALALALGLAACGRKGPLDPPLVAAAAQPAVDVQPSTSERREAAGGASMGPDGRPIAARGPQKRIFLDWLLD